MKRFKISGGPACCPPPGSRAITSHGKAWDPHLKPAGSAQKDSGRTKAHGAPWPPPHSQPVRLCFSSRWDPPHKASLRAAHAVCQELGGGGPCSVPGVLPEDVIELWLPSHGASLCMEIPGTDAQHIPGSAPHCRPPAEGPDLSLNHSREQRAPRTVIDADKIMASDVFVLSEG